jgi:murein DD-endopeptidase MepM/ murein hydrolase activator NlpD
VPDDRAPRRRFEHAHRVVPPNARQALHAPFAPPRPIGKLRIGSGRRRQGPPWLTLSVALSLIAVVLIALPLATRPAVAPAPTAAVTAGTGAVAVAPSTPVPTLGPHGDDNDPRSDPPIDREAQAHRARSAPILSGYRWPIRNARITNLFGKGYPGGFQVDGETAHDGIDLATWCGDRIVAAHDGVVLAAGRRHEGFVGWVDDLTAYRASVDAVNGWRSKAIAVVIDDGNGYRSVYVHLSRVNVKAGDAVEAGDLIGWEGATGNATGCHLHYALFSPTETDTWLLERDARSADVLPLGEIARIDPFLVMPPIESADITWGWGVKRSD